MGTRASLGFTVIETVLFLGITGLLVLGVLIGVGNNVNEQRYRDAAETFKSVVQSQYASVTNVQNGRSSQYVCNSVAGVVDAPVGQQPGQSSCFIIGKYVRIEKGEIDSYTILATARTGVTPTDTRDITLLKEAYTINLSRAEVESKEMEWGTEIATPVPTGSPASTATTPRSIGLLIIRSPDSGQVYTFVSNTVPTKSDIESLNPLTPPKFLSDMLITGKTTPGQAEQIVCVESSGLFTNRQMALYIAPYASGSSAIELVSNDTLTDRGAGVSCR